MAKPKKTKTSPKIVLKPGGEGTGGAAGRGAGAGGGSAASITRATKLKNQARAKVADNLKKAKTSTNPSSKKYFYNEVNDALKMVSQANSYLRKLQKNINK